MPTEHEQWVTDRLFREMFSRRIWIAAGFALAALVLLGPTAIPYLLTEEKGDSGLEAVRLIRSRAAIYAAKYNNGYPPTLEVLGPPPSSVAANCNHAGLLDEALARGRARGYQFEYRAEKELERAAPGCAAAGGRGFTLQARPMEHNRDARRSFFVDGTGVIHYTEENRTATASDPPVR